MEQNKVRTYLLYAFGEIFLVMIGILLALQVNNWNEERLARAEEKRIIVDLNNEFHQNLNDLNYDIKRLDTLYQALDSMMSIMLNPSIVNSDEHLNSLLAQTLDKPTWNPSFFVIEDLKNAGGLSRLSNEDLKNALFRWERYYSNVKEFQDAYNKTAFGHISFLKDNGSLRALDAMVSDYQVEKSVISESNQHLLKNMIYENYLDDLFVNTSQLLDIYIETVDEIEIILNLSSID